MASIIQIIASQRRAAFFTVYFCDIGHPCYDQLTSVNTVSADPYHVSISWAQVYSLSRSRFVFKMTVDPKFPLDRGLRFD